MQRELVNRVNAAAAVEPQSAAAINGANVDLEGYESCTILARHDGGGSADGQYDFKLQEADDDGTGSPDTWSDVAAGDLIGSFSEDFQADAAQLDTVGYIGNKRWVRVVVVEDTAATTAGEVAALAVRSHARHNPPA